MDDSLPNDLAEAHNLIRRLRGEIDELRAMLNVYQENERREFERLYGKGVTPRMLLDFGLLMAGEGGVRSSGNPDDPTCGELFARQRAEQRRRRRQRPDAPDASS